MTSPTTEYRGHTIRWSDNEDVWTCYDLSDKVRSSPKLSTLKGHIDRLYLAERKNNAVKCWEIGSGHGTQRIESNVVEYVRPMVQWRGDPRQYVEHRVAVVAQRSGSERPSRKEEKLAALMPVSPEADAAWGHYVNLRTIANTAERAAHEAFKALPRMQPSDIQPLIDLYERDKDADNAR